MYVCLCVCVCVCARACMHVDATLEQSSTKCNTGFRIIENWTALETAGVTCRVQSACSALCNTSQCKVNVEGEHFNIQHSATQDMFGEMPEHQL